ncbi:hypothetical protein UlMin_022454 [Ulmus minor]
MQRYHTASCSSAVNNSSIGGVSARDTARADSASLQPNYSLNSRRPPPLASYKLKCEKEPLNSRLGPPDFHPQILNCPEETLTKEYVQSGYREIVEGLEEAKEITQTQVQSLSKPIVFKCKEAIRKCLRAINDSRAQKRKAGQVYGVPLADPLLTKPGVFPEQKACGEDFRKKWIEGLSQQHKRLRSLADHVPHGFRKRSLFEVLVRNNVPLLRATWFIKVTCLNQVRPTSVSSGASDKAQLSRTELWTKDVIDYLQILLEEYFSKNISHSAPHSRDRSPQMLYAAGSVHQRGDPASTGLDVEEPSPHFKWWYMVRLLQWHLAEGLILPSLVIDWVLSQLQDKELLEIVQLLLPIIYGVLETVVLSQTYVRTLVGIAIHFIRDPSSGGSDLVDNSRKAYTTSALIEMLRYLIVAVPDTFVALDCFPLPSSVVSHVGADGSVLKSSEDVRKNRIGSSEISSLIRSKGLDARYQSLALDYVVSSIQRRADNLAKAVRPGNPSNSVTKVVQALDRSLVQGDVRGAHKILFEDLSEGAVNEHWIAEVSPCLRSSLKWIGMLNSSFICSVFLLCEWATCDFRDFRAAPPHELKFTGRKDFSQIYIAIRLLKLKIGGLRSAPRRKSVNPPEFNILRKCFNQQRSTVRTSTGDLYDSNGNLKMVHQQSMKSSSMFESPGPLHDIIVCWIDQHEASKGEGFERLQLFMVELIRAGIFYPQAYVRQLMVSGVMEMNGSVVEAERKKRHYQILKQLPGHLMRDTLERAGFSEGTELVDVLHIYSSERRLVLDQLLCDQNKTLNKGNKSAPKQKIHASSGKDGVSSASVDQWKASQSSSSVLSGKNVKKDILIEELKEAIAGLLQLPNTTFKSADMGPDETQVGVKRSPVSLFNKMDGGESTSGCEECRRVKRQKLGEERSSCLQGNSPTLSDDEDAWWVRKGSKSESLKIDPPLKSTKQVTKNRQKAVRKISLAHLAASRIEGSQGASTSHVCDNKISCPHHRTGMEGEAPRSVEGIKTNNCIDIASIGKAVKRLRFVEKRTITGWLMTVVRQLVEETEKTIAKVGQFGRSFASVDDKNAERWKLSEDELSAILYLMDVSNDLVAAVKFLLWLLPKVHSSPNSTIHSGRSNLLLSRNVESQVCEVGEAFLVSSLRRYENILAAQDLVPEALSAAVRRAAAVMASNGRASGSAALVYARYLLKKYGNLAIVVEWEKQFKATYDKRLVSELESGRSMDGELGFPLGVPAGVEDLDDFFRQKISGGRISRAGASMRDIVQRNLNVEDVLHHFFGKERKLFAAGAPKGTAAEKWDDGSQVAQKVISDLMDCIRQTGGAAQEGDPSLVSSAVSAIIGNVGPTIAKLPDFRVGSGYSNLPPATDSLSTAKRILRIHINCLSLLKEALGERQTRVFEVALATEATSALASVFAPGKASRNQFQLSTESLDSNSVMSGDNSTKVAFGRGTKVAAAVSALVVGVIVHGVTSLERMVTVFRLKEGLDIVQFIRTARSSSNGSSRSVGAFKIDYSVEAYVHWFRMLVGNCRTVCDGLVMDLLGEPSIIALSRMQRLLPVALVFPPAYAIFAFVLWRPFILNASLAIREDINQLYQSLTMAINDAIRHLPFRDVCLRDSQGFYDLVAADGTDAEFAAMLNGSDLHLKSKAFVPLRARLFLNAIIDCKMPHSIFKHEDGNRGFGHGDTKALYAESETKLLDKLVNVLDTLQPAKFHWQWIELRLLLNEQTLIEKLETHDMSLTDAIRSSSPSSEKAAASENENNFIQIILTRLLVRPDAASHFADVVHLFGRSLEDSMLLQAKWFLGGSDVLLGRKTIRQRLVNKAESEGLSTKAQFWRPWGWSKSGSDAVASGGEKKKFEATSLEEGEVVEEGMDSKRFRKGFIQTHDTESHNITQQHVTEKALIDLLLPCIDQSSDDSRNTFASDLIKQLNNIELQINAVTRGMDKQSGSAPSGIEGLANKVSNRKAIKGGSPGLARRAAPAIDSAPPSPAALRASMMLRLQLLLRLLPIICADGEPSGRNMKHMLASVILRLLGSRVVHEDVDLSFTPVQTSVSKRDVDSSTDAASAVADLSGESLFDRLLLVLHGLLSNYQPSWLRSKPASKSSNEYGKDISASDRELAENLQNDLDRMQLPDIIRLRIQSAMPVVLPSVRCFLNCQPPSIPNAALASLVPGISIPGFYSGNTATPQKNQFPSTRSATNSSGKSKPLPSQDHDPDIDPWTLLEDGAGSGPSSSSSALIGSGDQANLQALRWLKGTVRVRRKDLTYIGAVDDDS